MYDVNAIRKDFPVLERVIYLDNAATSQTPKPAVEAINEYFFTYAGNYGRGAHRLARQTTEHYENSRETVANFFSCEPANLSLIHISEPTRLLSISYAVFCLKKKKKQYYNK